MSNLIQINSSVSQEIAPTYKGDPIFWETCMIIGQVERKCLPEGLESILFMYKAFRDCTSAEEFLVSSSAVEDLIDKYPEYKEYLTRLLTGMDYHSMCYIMIIE